MDVRIDEPARLGECRLPGGRLLGRAEWGPADGVPVLLSPGAATSRWLGFGADVVDALGVRLVSVDRRGLGASDPAPGGRFPTSPPTSSSSPRCVGWGAPPWSATPKAHRSRRPRRWRA